MERYRALEKGFKKKQYSERSLKHSHNGKKYHSGNNGGDPICRKRIAVDSDGSNSFEDGDGSEEDDYDHGSDCNCGGEDGGSYDEEEDNDAYD